MSRSILSYTDRVMRENMKNRQLHYCAEPNRTSGIIAENEKSRTIGPNLHQRHPVQNCGHGMLANPKVKIATARVLGRDIARPFKGYTSFCRWGQIRRPPHQPGYALCQRV